MLLRRVAPNVAVLVLRHATPSRVLAQINLHTGREHIHLALAEVGVPGKARAAVGGGPAADVLHRPVISLEPGRPVVQLGRLWTSVQSETVHHADLANWELLPVRDRRGGAVGIPAF